MPYLAGTQPRVDTPTQTTLENPEIASKTWLDFRGSTLPPSISEVDASSNSVW